MNVVQGMPVARVVVCSLAEVAGARTSASSSSPGSSTASPACTSTPIRVEVDRELAEAIQLAFPDGSGERLPVRAVLDGMRGPAMRTLTRWSAQANE